MNKLMKLIAAAPALALLAACSGVPAQLGSTGTAPTGIKAGNGRNISAEACGFQLFAVIPLSINTRLARANEELVQKAAGDYIANVKVTESWSYGFVGTSYCTKLEATAYKNM